MGKKVLKTFVTVILVWCGSLCLAAANNSSKYTLHDNFSTILRENVTEHITIQVKGRMYCIIKKADSNIFRQTAASIEKQITECSGEAKRKLLAAAQQEGLKNASADFTIKVEKPDNSACVFIIQTCVTGEVNGERVSRVQTNIIYLQEDPRGLMAAGVAELTTVDAAELDLLRTDIKNFCTQKLQRINVDQSSNVNTNQSSNVNTNQSSNVNTNEEKVVDRETPPESSAAPKAEPSSYWIPPLGIFRGMATILMSPVNFFRGFALAFVKGGFYWLPENAVAGAVAMIGDCCLGTLDIISFGFLGNVIYSGDVTPWFWERGENFFEKR